MQLKTNFNKYPFVPVRGREKDCVAGWAAIEQELKNALGNKSGSSSVVIVETYQGIYYDELREHFKDALQPNLLIDTAELFLEEKKVREITQTDVTDDRVFGFMTRLTMNDLMDKRKLLEATNEVNSAKQSTIVIYGYGASLVHDHPDLMIYADMARWEIQLRMRANEVNNLGIKNLNELPELKYKRAYFVDWRICDRLKKDTIDHWDYVLDTNISSQPKLAKADAVREGLVQASKQPFSVVPFFDPGPWGGQWMKEKFELDKEKNNFAWCFNCVPEENSLLLGFGDIHFEIPSINVVFYRPIQLLGNSVHGRFGDEFPIRFDFLDTMSGGNLSLQVHPLTEYMHEKFGVAYTQDESYYMLDAGSDASVFLGLKEGVNPDEMTKELKIAEAEGGEFDVDKFVESWPAKKHDHFLIPAGTIHCSGANGMVLEISATPYIFTFKLYDWGRTNLDGKPRAINVEHGLKNIQWNRTTDWTRKNLVNQIEKVAEGNGWAEEKTGLHEREFIETRRHWFTKQVDHHTHDGVNVLTLIEGDEIIVESPDHTFKPFIVHYAETFIVPASVGKYTIRPYGVSKGSVCATIKAFVRSNP